jgi:cytoskeletal protein RodZ
LRKCSGVADDKHTREVLALKEIGDLLREAREACGMTLQQASEITKVRTKYLEAIENGEFAVIPGEVYLKGFIRTYADCLGLDGAQVIAQYNELRRARDSAALRQLEQERIGRMERTREERKQRRLHALGKSVLVVLIVAAVALVLYYTGRSMGLIKWTPSWLEWLR